MAEWLGLCPAPRRPRLLRLRRHQAGAPRPVRRQEGLHLRPGDRRPGLPLVTFARRLSPFWIAFIDNVAGQFALMKGYGKDPSVNGILASFWGLAADRQWSPDFHRVPLESNVSDAISRGDDSRARAEGWTRVATPVDDIMDVLGRAASDIDFACHSAPERLLDLAVW